MWGGVKLERGDAIQKWWTGQIQSRSRAKDSSSYEMWIKQKCVVAENTSRNIVESTTVSCGKEVWNTVRGLTARPFEQPRCPVTVFHPIVGSMRQLLTLQSCKRDFLPLHISFLIRQGFRQGVITATIIIVRSNNRRAATFYVWFDFVLVHGRPSFLTEELIALGLMTSPQT